MGLIFHCEHCDVSNPLFPAHQTWCREVETRDVVYIADALQEFDRLQNLLAEERAENERLRAELLAAQSQYLENTAHMRAENEALWRFVGTRPCECHAEHDKGPQQCDRCYLLLGRE